MDNGALISLYMYVCIYIYIYMYTYLYIYIERERSRFKQNIMCHVWCIVTYDMCYVKLWQVIAVYWVYPDLDMLCITGYCLLYILEFKGYMCRRLMVIIVIIISSSSIDWVYIIYTMYVTCVVLKRICAPQAHGHYTARIRKCYR